MKSLTVLLFVFALAPPVAAQSGQVTQQEADAFSVRGEGFFAAESLAASKTFDAVFGSSFAPFVGGGALIADRGFFLEIAVSHFSNTGQRAFVSDGQVYPLNIPLTVTIVPIEFTAGYRFLRRSSIIPYVGAGYGSYGYKETSSFSDPGDDVDQRHGGFILNGGAEFRFHKWVGVAADVQYTHVTGILGDAGISKEFGESDLGGTAFRVKVLVGVGR